MMCTRFDDLKCVLRRYHGMHSALSIVFLYNTHRDAAHTCLDSDTLGKVLPVCPRAPHFGDTADYNG